MTFRMPPALTCTLLTTLLAGCTVGPNYVRPPTAFSASFKEIKGWKQAQPLDDHLPDKWWEIFKDAELNTLEDQVNGANQSIAQAEAQYKQAQTLVQGAAVLLVKALGGGWNTAALPTRDQAGGEVKWSQFLPVPVN